jgi:hypothetical protein
VITTDVRYFLTSSITRKQRALNSPAGIVLIASPPDHGHVDVTMIARRA